MPSVKQVSSDQKDITFYRDDYAVKAKLMLPQGSGPYKTIVMRGEYGCSYSEYDGIAKFLNHNGYATLQVKNTHESEIVKRSGGSGSKIFADVYFEQVLDHFAVIDEMRYIPEIDMDNIYLWGHDLGGIISLYTGIERSDEIKGMIVVQPLLNNFQSLEFSKDPELIVRLYDLLPDCNVPTVIMEPENGLLSASKKATESMPDGKLILFEGEISKYADHSENNLGVKTLEALKSLE